MAVIVDGLISQRTSQKIDHAVRLSFLIVVLLEAWGTTN